MTSTPKLVSVVIPAYNAEQTIKRAIESVLAQSISDLDLTIVDDFSTDNTVDIALSCSLLDSRIKVVRCQRRHGMAYVVNKGVRKSTGFFVAKFDADDYSHPNRLALQLEALRQNSDWVGVGIGNIRVIESKQIPYFLKLASTPSAISVGLLFRGEFLDGTALYRRSILEKIPFPVDVLVGAGRLHAYRVHKAGYRMGNLSVTEPLFDYFRQNNGLLPKSEGPELDPVLIEILGNLGLNPTVENLQTHRAASRGLFLPVGAHPIFQNHLKNKPDLAFQWFDKLSAANIQTASPLFDVDTLDSEICNQLHEVAQLTRLKNNRTMVLSKSDTHPLATAS